MTQSNSMPAQETRQFIPFVPKKDLPEEFYFVCLPELAQGYLPVTQSFHIETASIPFPGSKDVWKIRTPCLGSRCAKCRHNKAAYRYAKEIPWQASQRIRRSFIVYLVYKTESGEFRLAQNPEPSQFEYLYKFNSAAGKMTCEDWTNLTAVLIASQKNGKNPFDPEASLVIKASLVKEAIPNKDYFKTKYVHENTGKTVTLPSNWKNIPDRYLPLGHDMHKMEESQLSQLVDISDKFKTTYQNTPAGIVIVKEAIYQTNINALKSLSAEVPSLEKAFLYYQSQVVSGTNQNNTAKAKSDDSLKKETAPTVREEKEKVSEKKADKPSPESTAIFDLNSVAGKTVGQPLVSEAQINKNEQVAGTVINEEKQTKIAPDSTKSDQPQIDGLLRTGHNEETATEPTGPKQSMSERLNSTQAMLQKMKENFKNSQNGGGNGK